MNSLQQFQGSGLATSTRSSGRLPASTNRALASLQQTTIIQTARVQAQTYLGREALFAVADISELEGQLAGLCPLATSRLEVIANMTTLSIARTVSEFRG